MDRSVNVRPFTQLIQHIYVMLEILDISLVGRIQALLYVPPWERSCI